MCILGQVRSRRPRYNGDMTTHTDNSNPSHLIYIVQGDDGDGMGRVGFLFACSSMEDAKFRLLCFWIEDWMNAEADLADMHDSIQIVKDQEDHIEYVMDGLGYTIDQVPCWD